MKKNFQEKDLQNLVGRWMKKNAWTSFCYELKISKGKTVPFSCFQSQQIPSLEDAYRGILHFKITDGFMDLKPCDAFVFRRSPAYVGILFEKNKQQNICYFIHIRDVLKIQKSGAKSIKLEDAEKFGIKINLRDIN